MYSGLTTTPRTMNVYSCPPSFTLRRLPGTRPCALAKRSSTRQPRLSFSSSSTPSRKSGVLMSIAPS